VTTDHGAARNAHDAATADRGAVSRPGDPTGAMPRCPDSDIGLVAQVDSPTYRVGQRPLFRLVVDNIGAGACTRDLDSGLRDLVVTDADGASIWANNDCDLAGHTDVRTLQPGKPLVFSVSWSARTSSPGCRAQRTAAPAGAYHLVAKLGRLTSKPALFTLTN